MHGKLERRSRSNSCTILSPDFMYDFMNDFMYDSMYDFTISDFTQMCKES